MIKLFEIISNFEKEVPRDIQWEKDNSGFQIGNLNQDITTILLCLEVTDSIVQEAIDKKVDLIFSHHPLLFSPLKKIDFLTNIGNIVKRLVKNDISLYSAHTNLDKFKLGTSYSLAERLGLQKIEILNNDSDIYYKIITFVPEDNIEKVTDALANAGAGKIGEYNYCSFRLRGQGTFQGSEKSNPFIGKKGEKEYIDEIRLEMIFPKWEISNIISELKRNHPYEEAAYDIYPLRNVSDQFGSGAIGETVQKLEAKEFLKLVKRIINVPSLKVAGDLSKSIQKVAVVGGAGTPYLQSAISKKADMFISSDLTYHTFFEAQNSMILVDAGHYETEIMVLDNLKNLLISIFNSKIEIIKTEINTNPINFF
jgi:dinuclear metal center YbgI/SA1388 family protein